MNTDPTSFGLASWIMISGFTSLSNVQVLKEISGSMQKLKSLVAVYVRGVVPWFALAPFNSDSISLD